MRIKANSGSKAFRHITASRGNSLEELSIRIADQFNAANDRTIEDITTAATATPSVRPTISSSRSADFLTSWILTSRRYPLDANLQPAKISRQLVPEPGYLAVGP